MKLAKKNMLRRSDYVDQNGFNFDSIIQESKYYQTVNSSIGSYRQTHSNTFHMGDNKVNSDSLYSNESNYDTTKKTTIRSIIRPHTHGSDSFQPLSNLTQQLIPEFERNLKTISKIENRMYSIEINNEQNLHKKEQIGEGEILINYQQDNRPIQLQSDKINIQKVRQLEFYYYKIKCYNEDIPLTFTMFLSEQTRFKIFVSTTNPFPSKFSCDSIFQIKSWKYKNKDTNQFQAQFVFISLVCEMNTTIKIQYQFGATLKTNSFMKSPTKLHKIQNLIGCNLTAQQIIRKRKAKMLSLAKGRNLIQENIMNVTLQHDISFREQKRNNKIQQFKQIIQNAKMKKQNEIEIQQQTEINYFSKELTTLIKKQQNKINIQCEQIQHSQLIWFQLLAILQLGQNIKQKLIIQQKLANHVIMIKFKLRKMMRRASKNLMKRKGITLIDRAKFDSKLCLSMFCKSIRKKQQSYSMELIYPILKTRALLWNFKQQIHQTIKQITKIKNAICEFNIRYREYKLLIKIIFEKRFDQCYNEYYKKQNNIDTKIENWYNQTKYILYYQYIAKIFVKIFTQQKLKLFYNQTRKARLNKKALKRSNTLTQSDILKSKNIKLFYVPLINEIIGFIPKLYEITKDNSQQFTKDVIRKICNQNNKKQF